MEQTITGPACQLNKKSCPGCDYMKQELCDYPYSLNIKRGWTQRQEEYEILRDLGFNYMQIIKLVDLRQRYLAGGLG